MIRAIIRIIVAVAVLNAAVRVGFAYWGYYQLKDTAQQLIVFEFNTPTGKIRQQILNAAMELSVPLEAQNLEVIREGTMTFVNVWYVQPVEVIPSFPYPLEMSFFVQARALDPIAR